MYQKAWLTSRVVILLFQCSCCRCCSDILNSLLRAQGWDARSYSEHVSWGPFLESSSKFRAWKHTFKSKCEEWEHGSWLANYSIFVSLTNSFIMLDAKLLEPLSCMQTTTALCTHWLWGLSRNWSLVTFIGRERKLEPKGQNFLFMEAAL